MKFKRVCTVCGKDFFTTNQAVKICSDECRKRRRKELHDKWLEKHPGYMHDYFVINRDQYSRAARAERKKLRESYLN